MGALADHRPQPLARSPQPAAGGGGRHVAAASGATEYLAVVLRAAAESGAPAVAEWRAELKLAECGCALPLAWPLPQWLDDYRRLLATALADRKIEPCAQWWAGAARAFLPLLLAARDESVAEFIRTLTHRHPLAEETRRLRRVQALFTYLRPARSLVEGFGFAIVTPSDAS